MQQVSVQRPPETHYDRQAHPTTAYKNLIRRFLADDETLTDADYRQVYYGFAATANYDPWSDQHCQEIAGSLRSGDHKKALRFCDAVLQQAPVSLFANRCKGQLTEGRASGAGRKNRHLLRAEKLIKTILANGDGHSSQTAFPVLFALDEYEILYHHFGIMGYRSQVCGSQGDCFCIEPNDRYPAAKMHFRVLEPPHPFFKN